MTMRSDGVLLTIMCEQNCDGLCQNIDDRRLVVITGSGDEDFVECGDVNAAIDLLDDFEQDSLSDDELINTIKMRASRFIELCQEIIEFERTGK